jgi:hypothetical protein
VLNLQINVEEPVYDKEGAVIHQEEDDDEELLERLDLIFNRYLLDEDTLNS